MISYRTSALASSTSSMANGSPSPMPCSAVRPAEHPFMTAIITLQEHPQGTEYVAHVMHKNERRPDDARKDGLRRRVGTVTEQLAKLTEQRAPSPARP